MNTESNINKNSISQQLSFNSNYLLIFFNPDYRNLMPIFVLIVTEFLYCKK